MSRDSLSARGELIPIDHSLGGLAGYHLSDSLSTNQVYVSGGVKSLHGVKSINLSAPTFIKVYYLYFISIRVPITLLLH
jgi:hypothetical protein